MSYLVPCLANAAFRSGTTLAGTDGIVLGEAEIELALDLVDQQMRRVPAGR